MSDVLDLDHDEFEEEMCARCGISPPMEGTYWCSHCRPEWEEI